MSKTLSFLRSDVQRAARWSVTTSMHWLCSVTLWNCSFDHNHLLLTRWSEELIVQDKVKSSSWENDSERVWKSDSTLSVCIKLHSHWLFLVFGVFLQTLRSLYLIEKMSGNATGANHGQELLTACSANELCVIGALGSSCSWRCIQWEQLVASSLLWAAAMHSEPLGCTGTETASTIGSILSAPPRQQRQKGCRLSFRSRCHWNEQPEAVELPGLIFRWGTERKQQHHRKQLKVELVAFKLQQLSTFQSETNNEG